MTSANELYIGLMSGTSVDSVDAALVCFSNKKPKLIHSYEHTIPQHIKEDILSLCTPGADEIDRLGQLNVKLGHLFAEAANTLINEAKVDPASVTAIGSHGQTIRHRPGSSYPFTLQIGDPNTIALHTQITTVADFRQRDIALGGQGAPLAPAFHENAFQSDSEARTIVNLGGMANITHLSPTSETIGFDTGPGNVLMDGWIKKQLDKNYDKNGQWASTGKIHSTLLEALMEHPFLAKKGPKSTGREDFNLNWLEETLRPFEELASEDVQRTLLEYTAKSLTEALKQNNIANNPLYLCGGGAYNAYLVTVLEKSYGLTVHTTSQLEIPPEWVEACAFAWLAKQTMHKQPGNLPKVTGAKEEAVLGAIYAA